MRVSAGQFGRRIRESARSLSEKPPRVPIYAVAKGHTPGIYFSKKAVMNEVTDFDSPIFAKVLTIEAAKKFLTEFTPAKDLESGEN
ncbi:unnamed protein product [Oikopleura dioica]|uniref:Ribonuclease H1 N-terminal domain-containing protein n=1 Tax=Oikopleura dioica TaxID=34765 RepID=E4WZZ6_OIKDI|nr:unnamed protein product [Oikopleura dioica]